MCFYDWYMYQTFQPDPIFTSLISGLLGSAIGCFATYKATDKAHKHNIELKEMELNLYEKATALSIVEELKCLQYAFGEEFNYYFSDISEKTYIEYPITITQDYTTIYTENANKIGNIKNYILRNDIIKTYTLLKKFIENILHYNPAIEKLWSNRFSFIKRMYPQTISNDCADYDIKEEIKKIKDNVEKNIFNWTIFKGLNDSQIINFLKADDTKEEDLIKWSNDLKELYEEIKKLINDIINLSEKEYIEDK